MFSTLSPRDDRRPAASGLRGGAAWGSRVLFSLALAYAALGVAAWRLLGR